ncbi:MAG: 2-hydroxyacyl-CoA dehydratase family protein [Candidatus Auribacterota bacterium]|jgi:benzoyl-CoA reductase/2-hydroxyglutaryl-CoA dehydratase subunit BcrC/BadD/HgdB|nr:2-hydroxyacyl-CoA dehydratase family protein [Candidatus Auribacterota bacterium]
MPDQFDETYKIRPTFQDNPGNLKKQRFVEDEQKRRQSQLADRPSNIAYFESILYNRDFSRKNVPWVGYFCNMIPQEIIRALGAQPIRVDCGNAAAAQVGEEVLSGDICPLAKASFGMFLNDKSLENFCDILVLPASCDAKRKLGQIMNDYKPTFMYNIPPEQNHSLYAHNTFSETNRLVAFLEKKLDAKLSGKELRRQVRLSHQRTLLIRDLQEARIHKPQAISMSDFFIIIQSSLFRPVDLEEWIEQTRQVCKQIQDYSPARKSLRPRIVLTGAPIIWPNYKVINLLEESGADIIADTLCTGAQSLFDPPMTDEWSKQSLIRALSNRYVYAAICPCFISQTTRINRVIDLCETSGATGVANYSLRLCQLFDMENYRLERTLKEKKIPAFTIRTDYSLEDTEQLRVRIEAFLETL